MSSGMQVDPEDLRAHAVNLRGLMDRYDAIRQASAHIVMSDDAYGQLCQMLPPLMEERHQDQDDGMEALAENLELLAQAIEECAADYEGADTSAAEDFAAFESEF